VKEAIRACIVKCTGERKLLEYAVLDKYSFMQEIPGTSGGKIRKIECRKKFR